MALNLIRNSKVFFTTNINTTTGIVNASSTTTYSSSNIFELQVLDGFSFSQNTNAEQVTVSEAGTTPARGQRSFNTSLAPVDFSFSTYIRPDFSTNVICEESLLWNALLGSDAQNTAIVFTGMTAATYSATAGELTITMTSGTSPIVQGDKVLVAGITSSATGTNKANDERVVNGPGTIKTVTGATGSITQVVITMDNQANTLSTTPAVLSGTLTTTGLKLYSSAWGASPGQSIAGAHRSNTNQLQKFGMLFLVDNVLYAVDNCALNEATIDFGLDGIATIAWTGQATALRQFATGVTASGGTFTGGAAADVGSAGAYATKNTDANYITNKLSTCRLKTARTLGGGTFAVTPYYLAITGGSITISNNITYITPAILGIVNQAITYYTGTRSVTGTLNAYLNTGALTGVTQEGVNVTKGTGELLKDLLAVAATETEPMFYLELAIGGTSNAVRVELQMPSVSIGVPAINTEQVVSTAITFTGAPSTGAYTARTYDLEKTNELTVRYYSN
jgi:hypothetical protein